MKIAKMIRDDIFSLWNDFRCVGVVEDHNDCNISSNDSSHAELLLYSPTVYIRRSQQWYHIQIFRNAKSIKAPQSVAGHIPKISRLER